MTEHPRERILPAAALLAVAVAAAAAGFVVGLNWHAGNAAPAEGPGRLAELRAEYERLASDYRRELALLDARRRELDSQASERELLAEVRATLAKESAEVSRDEARALRERLRLLESLLEVARSRGYLPTVKLPPRGGAPAEQPGKADGGGVDVMAVEQPESRVDPPRHIIPPPPDGSRAAPEGGQD